MRTLDVPVRQYKVYAAWLGEKLARLKPNGCADHLRQLAPFGEKYGTSVRPDKGRRRARPAHRRPPQGAELLGRSEASGVLLLRDLRNLYLAAQEAEIAWVILIQAARAIRDQNLTQVATACHEQAETRGKWLRTRIKETAPQVLATG